MPVVGNARLQTGALPLLGIAVCASYVLVTMWAIGATTYDIWAALLILPLLFVISLPILHRVASHDEGLSYRLLVVALTLKMVSSLVRYWQSYVLYDTADSERYHKAGIRIAQALRDGTPWAAEGPFPGTAFIEGLTGYLYWPLGATLMGGFFVFSWLGFWGLLLFHRAFAIGVPNGDTRRYALLVLFLPSLLFWPSSIGKDAWMTLCLGLSAYGAARLLARRRAGTLLLAVGVAGVSLVRPHMAVLLVGGVLMGYLCRPYSRRGLFGPVVKAAGLLTLTVAAAVVVSNAERFFGVDSSADRSVGAVLDDTVARTQQGGSSFEATPVSSPADLPMATVSVLLRPFPWEATSLQALVAAAESMLLLGLCWLSRRRLLALPGLLRRQPYVAFAVTYTLLFIVAFSSFANFGILTRQRVQVFPLVLVLLALPPSARRARKPPYVPVRAAVRPVAPATERLVS